MSVLALALVVATGAAALPPGSYRLDVEVVVVASVPVLGEQKTRTLTTSVVEIDDQDMATARACRVETRGPGFSSRMPPTTLRALPVSRFKIVDDGQTVRADMGEGRLGFTGPGPLPQSAADPRVTDPDRDGKPGLKLLLDLGALGNWTLQIVSQGRTAFAGQKTADGAAGRLTIVQSEEQVLSGLPISLPARADAIDPSKSSFTLKRVAARDESFCSW